MMNNPKKLTKSRSNRFVSGVAGGLGDYFNIDPLVFRVLFVVLSFAGGFGALAYLILLIMMPEDYSFLFQNSKNSSSGFRTEEEVKYEVVNDRQEQSRTEEPKKESGNREKEAEQGQQNEDGFSTLYSQIHRSKQLASFAIGFLLIIFGAFILLAKILSFNWWQFIFPMILLITGAIILILSINAKK